MNTFLQFINNSGLPKNKICHHNKINKVEPFSHFYITSVDI